MSHRNVIDDVKPTNISALLHTWYCGGYSNISTAVAPCPACAQWMLLMNKSNQRNNTEIKVFDELLLNHSSGLKV